MPGHLVNPLRTHRYVNPPHNFTDKMLVRQVLRMKNIISLRCDLDITPNSHDYRTRKSMFLVGRINVSIVGMKWLTSIAIESTYELCEHLHSPFFLTTKQLRM